MTFHTGESRTTKIAKPSIEGQPTDVLVKVKYSALDTATKDVVDKTITGYFVHSRSNPLIVGWHYSGTVIALGSETEEQFGLHTGDEVWGFLEYSPKQKQGAFSEYIVVAANKCARVPSTVDLKVAAAAATESITALQALRDYGELTSGESSVLILGAGGGVGSAAVGIAKRLGAKHVTAVCSTKDVKRVKLLGADVVLDRSKVDVFAIENNKYDLIFDTPAKYSALQCFKSLTPKGHYVVTIPSFSLVAAKFVGLFNGKTASFVECDSNRKDLELIGQWLVDGLVVDIDSTYPIRDIQKAMVRQQDKSKVGRVVVEVLGGW